MSLHERNLLRDFFFPLLSFPFLFYEPPVLFFSFFSYPQPLAWSRDALSSLTCGVHDVVHQVCEAGRGLVRQQVGEEIPGASHGERETERQSMTCLTRELKQTESIKLSNI